METDNLLNFSVSIEDASTSDTTATTNAVLIKQDEKVVFPITHTSALIGPISDRAYNIDNDVYNNVLDLVTTNGLYYGGPYSDTKCEFLYQSYFLVQVISYDRCSIQIILSTASDGVGLLGSNYTGNPVAYRSGYQDSDSFRVYWDDWKQYTPTIPTASATTIGGIKVGENLTISSDGTLSAQATGGTSDYTALENKPILNTDNTESQTTNNNETINGTINLHKVSKTGSYDDLNNKLNLVNGSANNSLRMVGSRKETTGYTIGQYAFAEGSATRAPGHSSHAEGFDVVSSGKFSHSEGSSTLTGAKGYTILSADSTAKTYTLSTVSGISVNDNFIIMTDTTDTDTLITAIDSNSKTVTVTAFAELASSNNFLIDKSDVLSGDAYINTKGDSAHAEGNSTIAFGDDSHAEGLATSAYGQASHSEGHSTIAYDEGSHAEGGDTLAGTKAFTILSGDKEAKTLKLKKVTGIVSGMSCRIWTDKTYTDTTITSIDTANETVTVSTFGTLADTNNYLLCKTNPKLGDVYLSNKAKYSHAEGWYSTASVDGAHAEGYGTVASGIYSHAEGRETSATHTAAHAEGYTTTASGQASHAEGYKTAASAVYSHAEGNNTTASNEAAHAEGYMSKASDKYSHAEGYSTRAQSIGSHAEGNNTTASGNYSHAEGFSTKASGNYSHSEGSDTQASGSNSHAEGVNSKATGGISHAEGNFTTSSGAWSHAEGGSTIASGFKSHAEGDSTNATTEASHTEGYRTLVGGNRFTIVSGDSATKTYILNSVTDLNTGYLYNIQLDDRVSDVTITNIDTATNKITVDNYITLADTNNYLYCLTKPSIGDVSSDIAVYAHAEGDYTIASGYASHAEGSYTVSSGSYAHAEGLDVIASGERSHAEGRVTIASGISSHAEGDSTKASGSASHAEGSYTKSLGYASHAEGQGTIASDINSHAEGYSTTASGSNSHAEGLKTTASNLASHAEGGNTVASGGVSHAEGSNTVASGNVAHAEGLQTISAGIYQHVQGKFNIEDTNNKYAHIVGNGDESTSTRSNAHTLDWEGNSWYAGAVIVGGTSDTSANGRMKYNADTESIDFIFN